MGKGVERWGHVGSSNQWDESRRMLVRIVGAAEEYHVPPLGNNGPVWKEEDQQTYVMELDACPDQAVSLADVCHRLEPSRQELRRRKCDAANDPDVRKLKDLASRLLETVKYLHARNCGVGILTHENILLVPSDEGDTLVLPDLGFIWKVSTDTTDAGASQIGAKPRWIQSHEYNFLWGENGDPRQQQWRGVVDHGSDDKFDPHPDIRTLGRIFATALLGRECSEVPPPTSENGTDVPVWSVLEKAIGGKFGSIEELASALDEAPIIEHYLGRKNSPPPSPWGQKLLWVFPAVVVLVLLITVGLYYIDGCGPQPTVICGPQPTVIFIEALERASKLDPVGSPVPLPAESRLVPSVKQFEESGSDYDKALEAIGDMMSAAPSGEEALMDVEAGWVVYARRKWVEKWKKRVRLAEDLLDDPLRYPEASPELGKLQAQLQALKNIPTCKTLKTEERSCLDYIELLLGQL